MELHEHFAWNATHGSLDSAHGLSTMIITIGLNIKTKKLSYYY